MEKEGGSFLILLECRKNFDVLSVKLATHLPDDCIIVVPTDSLIEFCSIAYSKLFNKSNNLMSQGDELKYLRIIGIFLNLLVDQRPDKGLFDSNVKLVEHIESEYLETYGLKSRTLNGVFAKATKEYKKMITPD